MQLRKWKVKNEIVYLPIKWDKDKVMSFLNTNIKICHICGKIDITKHHYKEHWSQYKYY